MFELLILFIIIRIIVFIIIVVIIIKVISNILFPETERIIEIEEITETMDNEKDE